MADQNTVLVISHRAGDLPANSQNDREDDLIRYAQYLEGVAGGLVSKARVTVIRGSTNAIAQAARERAAISGGAGAVGVVINGVTVTAAFAVSDTNSAGLVAAAVNASADPLVQGLVRATNFKMRVTCGTTVAAGDVLQIGDYRFEMVLAAVDREGRGDMGTVVLSAVANTMATNLAAAMNAHPKFGALYVAFAVAAVVHIFHKNGLAPVNNNHSVTGVGITLTDTTFAAGADVAVFAVQAGKLGNAQTIAASGTGVSIPSTNTRLVGGVGGDYAGLAPSHFR